MKVKELCSQYEVETGHYHMYYATEIEGRQIIFERTLSREWQNFTNKSLLTVRTVFRPIDSISQVFDFGNHYEKFQNAISNIVSEGGIYIQTSSQKDASNKFVKSENLPQMTYGKETDLLLANIKIDMSLSQYSDLYFGKREPKSEKEKRTLDTYNFLLKKKS